MTNSLYLKARMTKAALEFVPPLIRQSLFNDAEFRNEYGLKAEAVITIGDSGFSIQRTKLFDSLRAVLAGEIEVEVTDSEGCEWHLRNEPDKEGQPNLFLSSGKQRFSLPNFAVFSQDASIRVRALEDAASDVNLPIDARDNWRNILTGRALEDDEFDTFHSDLLDTPVHLARSIHHEVSSGQASMSTLVPNSQRFYHRLVGTYDKCQRRSETVLDPAG